MIKRLKIIAYILSKFIFLKLIFLKFISSKIVSLKEFAFSKILIIFSITAISISKESKKNTEINN